MWRTSLPRVTDLQRFAFTELTEPATIVNDD
jgi:hypothetical protein